MTITAANLSRTIQALIPMNETLRADLIDALATDGHGVDSTGPECCSVEQLLRRWCSAEGIAVVRRKLDNTVFVEGGLFGGHYATPHRIAELRPPRRPRPTSCA
jgi:hypothetical protein